MARRNKKHTGRNIFIGVALILLVFVIGGYFLFSSGFFEQAALPLNEQCYVVSSGVTQNAFQCDGGKCLVRVSDECSGSPKTSESVVIARARDSLYGDRGGADVPNSAHWIALDNPKTDYYDLESWVMTSTLSSTLRGADKTMFDLPYGWEGFISDYDGKHRLYIPVPNEVNKYYYYTQKAGADLDPTVKYDCRDQELCQGELSVYECSKDILVNNVLHSTITYKAKSPGSYISDVITLMQGQNVTASGGKIEWVVTDDSKACSISKCNDDGTGYFACSTGQCPALSTTLTKCNDGEICVQSGPGGGAACSAPFTTSGEILSGRTAGDPVAFKYTIKSNTISSVYITYKLVDISDRSQPVDIKPDVQTSLPSDKTITFNPLSVGSYEIIVEKTYNGKSVAAEVYPFIVGAQLTTNVFIPQSPLTGTNLIVGSPFYVDVQAVENDMVVTELVSIDVKATLTDVNNKIETVSIPTGQLKSTPNGDVMRYTFTLDKAGKFNFEAAAKKFGVPSKAKSRTADIKPSKIAIAFSNMGYLVNIPPGTKTVMFETKDPFDNYIDVNYKVKVIPAGAAQGTGDVDVTNKVTKQSGLTNTGKYQFDFEFKTGAYIIEIYQVTAPGYSVDSSIKSPSINVDATASPPECVSSTDCAAGYICLDGKCEQKEPPYMLYILLMGGGIILIILVVVIVRLMRRKSAPNIPMTGGGL